MLGCIVSRSRRSFEYTLLGACPLLRDRCGYTERRVGLQRRELATHTASKRAPKRTTSSWRGPYLQRPALHTLPAPQAALSASLLLPHAPLGPQVSAVHGLPSSQAAAALTAHAPDAAQVTWPKASRRRTWTWLMPVWAGVDWTVSARPPPPKTVTPTATSSSTPP